MKRPLTDVVPMNVIVPICSCSHCNSAMFLGFPVPVDYTDKKGKTDIQGGWFMDISQKLYCPVCGKQKLKVETVGEDDKKIIMPPDKIQTLQ